MRKTYVWDNELNKFVDVEEYRPKEKGPKLNYIEDTMEPTWHPCDGKYYTSKHKFRATTRAHGKTEVGNDPAFLKEKPVKDNSLEFKKALWQAWDQIGYRK